jgi:hypothetical protein
MAINPLQPPINYMGMAPQIDLAKQFEGFGQALAERQKRTQAEETKALYTADLERVLNNPSISEFNKFAIKYPQQREVIKDVASRFTTEQQDAEFNIGRDVAVALENGKPEIALGVLNKTIEARKGSNLPTTVYDQIQQILSNTEDPDRVKKAQAQTNFSLTLLNPEKFAKVAESLQKQKLAPEEFGEQQAKTRQAITEAQTKVADLRIKLQNEPIEAERLLIKRDLELAQAEEARIKAKYAERTAVDRIIADAAGLGLTKAQTNEVLAKTNKLGIETKQAAIQLKALEATGGVDPDKKFTQEEKIRKEHQTRTKVYGELQGTFSNIKSSADTGNGPGDIALITSFMKMLDPGSVVRETEFATARDTAGLFTQLENRLQKAKDGQLLNPAQRKEYVALAQKYLESAQKKAGEEKVALGVIVKNYKLNPENVFGPDETTIPVGGGRGTVNPPTVGQLNVTVSY